MAAFRRGHAAASPFSLSIAFIPSSPFHPFIIGLFHEFPRPGENCQAPPAEIVARPFQARLSPPACGCVFPLRRHYIRVAAFVLPEAPVAHHDLDIMRRHSSRRRGGRLDKPSPSADMATASRLDGRRPAWRRSLCNFFGN